MIKDESEGGSFGALWRRHWQAALAVFLGLVVTVGLTVSSALSYSNNEQKLTSLQTRLTASVIQTAQPELQAELGRVVGLTAAAPNPVAAFQAAMASELAPRGQFASSTLAVVKDGHINVLAHLGSAVLQPLASKATVKLFVEAAHSSVLVTSRVVGTTSQKLGYLMAARGPNGVFVVGASQQLPVGRRVQLPAGSPYANLNFALYFGPSATAAALVETDATRLPLTGTVAKAAVPFGNNVLTLVASPRQPLASAWSEYLPWGVLALGMLLSVGFAGTTELLVRRRRDAELVASASQELYQQQRKMSETLQRSLLPKRLPSRAGWEFAARYQPATKAAEIGGDWYSVVEIDNDKFVVVIGDVSGHDIAAAGVMAALRYTIRTLAKQGISPERVLQQTTTELDIASDDRFATVLIGVIDPRMEEITLASAGHLPPLLLKDGRIEYLEIPPGVPLGVPGPQYKATTLHFPPGSTLITFTDGLIERRGEPLDSGLDQLAATVVGSPADAGHLISHVLDELTTPEQEDDIAVLVVRFTGDTAVGQPASSETSHGDDRDTVRLAPMTPSTPARPPRRVSLAAGLGP